MSTPTPLAQNLPASASPAVKAAGTLATVAAASPKKKFQDMIEGQQFKDQIALALPKHLTPDRFIRVLMTAALKTPQLLECTQESLFKGIFDCAALGLEIDGRRAHLIPLRNRQKQGQPLEANLWLDYKGVAELVMRSGLVSTLHADVVCEQDVFEEDRGRIVKHSINRREERGEVYAAYCIITMKDGGEKAEVMGIHEINAVRQRSPGKNSPAWNEHFAEMAKKTVFKRASKWVPLSSEVRGAIENEHEEEPLNVTPRKSLAGLIGAAETLTERAPVAEAEVVDAAGAPALTDADASKIEITGGEESVAKIAREALDRVRP